MDPEDAGARDVLAYDHIRRDERLSSGERQLGFDVMIRVALEAAPRA